MEFRILGPLEVRNGQRSVPVGGSKPRSLLAVLLLNANRVVATTRLVDELWGESAPATAERQLVPGYVHALRKQLGTETVETHPPGYRLRLDSHLFDLAEFERLTEQARSAPPDRAAQLYRRALALWRGPPLADVVLEGPTRNEVGRLGELQLACEIELFDAELALGRHAQLIGELEALAAAHPYQERLHAQLMLALYRSGRQVEALEAYQAFRRTLDEELGLQPGHALRELEAAIIRQDEQLALPDARPGAPPRPPAPSQAPRLPTKVASRRRKGLLVAAAALVLAGAIAGVLVAFTGGGSRPPEVGPTSLAVIDPRLNAVVDSIDLGFKTDLLAAGEGYVWAVDPAGATLSKIDPRTHEVRRIGIAVGAGDVPFGIAAGAGAVWVAVARGPQQVVLELGPEVGELRHTIRYGGRAQDIYSWLLHPLAVGEGAVWAIDSAGGSVWRIDPNTRKARQFASRLDAVSIAVGRGAVWLAGSSGVTKLDAVTGLQLGSAPVGARTFSERVSIALGRNAVWYAASSNGRLSELDPQVVETTETFPVGRGSSSIAVNKGTVWVANSRDGTISRLDAGGRVPETIKVGEAPGEVVAAYDTVWASPSAPRS